MKTVSLLIFIACAFGFGCSSKTEPLPTDTWSQGCIELAPYQGTYKLSGLCCTSINFPQLRLDKNRAFSVKGTYYTFNGAGIINFPLVVNGQLSPDASTLSLSYSINSTLTTHTLKPGDAIVSCDCSCN
jgi:hypothetical protein